MGPLVKDRNFVSEQLAPLPTDIHILLKGCLVPTLVILPQTLSAAPHPAHSLGLGSPEVWRTKASASGHHIGTKCRHQTLDTLQP